MNYATGAVLDAPDLAVRRIMQKRQDGQRLTDRELTRLGQRQSAEAETGRTGGTVRQSIQPRRLDAYAQGTADAADEARYAAGRSGQPDPGVRRAPPAATAPATQRPAAPQPAAIPFEAPAALTARQSPTTTPRTEATEEDADMGKVRRLSDPVAPAVGAGPGDSFLGGGGSYMARFKTRRSAQTFADLAAEATAADTQRPSRSTYARRLDD